MKVITCSYHRNGSGIGTPFVTVIFEHHNDLKFIATFTTGTEPLEIKAEWLRVNRLDFPEMPIRSHEYGHDLCAGIADYCRENNLNEISIAAACNPAMYRK